MSQEQEDLIIAMIAQAQEAQELAATLLNQAKALQDQAEKTQRETKDTLVSLPTEVRQGVAASSRAVLQDATAIAVAG